jgi:predicted HTH transcriptional regulator
MNEKIENLIKSEESERLEFKSSLADVNEIVEEVLNICQKSSWRLK